MNINATLLNDNVDSADSDYCISCVMGKHKQLSFSTAACCVKATTELINSDVWGPANTASSTGNYYFMKFTGNDMRYSVVYLMHMKLEVVDDFKHFAIWIKTQFGGHIQCLCSDNDGEYVFGNFLHYLAEHDIEHEMMMPYILQQNSVVEHGHQTVVMHMLSSHHLSRFPHSFWGWAILNSAYIKDMLLSSCLLAAFYLRPSMVKHQTPNH